jgi:hypothetical protein
MPEDLLENAKTIITYFLPFEKIIADSNKDGKNSSRKWILSALGRLQPMNCLISVPRLKRLLLQQINQMLH